MAENKSTKFDWTTLPCVHGEDNQLNEDGKKLGKLLKSYKLGLILGGSVMGFIIIGLVAWIIKVKFVDKNELGGNYSEEIVNYYTFKDRDPQTMAALFGNRAAYD